MTESPISMLTARRRALSAPVTLGAADFEKILEALDIPWEAEANPQRTTELYCIVVTADED